MAESCGNGVRCNAFVITRTEEAKNAADEGVRQGVTEGVFEESKKTVEKLIDKGFGLFRD